MSDLVKQAMRRGPQCPPLDSVLAGKEPNHVAGCPGCEAEIAMFESFNSPLPVSPAEREAIPFIVERLRPRPWWARLFGSRARTGGLVLAAAALMLTVSIGNQWWARQNNPLPDEAAPVYRSAAIRVETPLDNLTEAPAVIRWQPVKDAARYDVSITEVDRAPIFHNSLTTSVLTLPPEVAKLLVPGKTVHLSIIARDSAGKEIASSGLLALRIQIPAR